MIDFSKIDYGNADGSFSVIHQSGVLYFSSFQSSKQPIRFVKISLTSRFCPG